MRAAALGAALCAFHLAAPTATAGVISGTGAAPSRTTLGASNAVAFRVSETAPGHHLMFPYFTVQRGQMTVLHLINTDFSNGKAVKLRFRGAGNGDSLLSLQVLMAPGDTWTAALTTGPDGRAQLATADNTCTYPALLKGTAQPFLADRLNPAWNQETANNNTREGTVEALLMADIPSAKLYGAQADAHSNLYLATRLLTGQAPCTLSSLDDALNNDISDETQASGLGFATPSGGLSATWYIIDVPGSTTLSGPATSVVAVDNAGASARGNFVVFPQTTLVVDRPERYTADPLLVSSGLASRSKTVEGVTASPTASQVVQAQFHDLPDLSTPYYLSPSDTHARQTAADLTGRLLTNTVRNQYARDASISAQTDWILSMPTKRYSVGYDYSQEATTALVYSVVPPVGGGQVQFYDSTSTLARSHQACESYVGTAADREGVWTTGGPILIAPPPNVASCGAAAIVSFNAGASVLSSSVSRWDYGRGFTNGWMSLAPEMRPGRPVIGAAVLKLTNPNATPGVAANYGITFPHILSRQP
ncbi:MAG: surface layer protein NpdA [Gammaproteobacteria bacterium]|nr:surface layer protein NpdA [Gammaproteobacteria bacterium]MBU0891847.1 surface layer protein NpdA [Gammaproteobacteria bacterium]